MAMKIALIVAVAFLAQGFAFKLSVRPVSNPLCTGNVIPEAAEEIPHDLEEAMESLDDVRETISVSTMEAYLQEADPAVIIACFRAQRQNYFALGRRIHGLVRKAAAELAKDLGDQVEKYGKRAQESLRIIGITMKTLPQKMWNLIKDKEFEKALEVMKESRRIVRENAIKLAQIVNEFRGELPEVAQKADKMAQEIRAEARTGALAIRDAFRKCVEEGGPQKPIDDVEDVEVDEEEFTEF